MDKLKVGILGATGAVGQRFVQLLADHPWFEITALAASAQSAGKTYRQACNWFLSADIPAHIADMVVQPIEPTLDCQLVFSALPSETAGPTEEAFAAAGYGVLSNAGAHRMDEDVPLVTAEVNPEHLAILPAQQAGRGWKKGFIVANSNCSAMPVVISLKPLADAFGLKSVMVHTMQALSGAGYDGVPSLAALDNVIPFIKDEEEKMHSESEKMLGSYADGKMTPLPLRFSAHCNRVPTLDGHLETISVELVNPPADLATITELWQTWHPLPQQLNLPSAPKPPIIVRSEANRPQTRLDRDNGAGMATTVGRLRPCPVLGIKFVVLSHNTVRGAAGASILNAELLWAQGQLEGLR